MTALFWFTIRQILGQRKLWLSVAALLFPAAIAVLVRSVGGDHAARHAWEMYHVLMQRVLITVLVPLVCLLYGTALIGAEVEQRTLAYLTTRRLHRATVLLVRFAATWSALTVLFALALLALHLGVTWRSPLSMVGDAGATWAPGTDLRAYLAIAPAGAAGYLAVFTTVSLAFRRPLIVAVVYFVLFELVLGNLPVPIQRLSISHALRQTMVTRMPAVRRLYELPPELSEIIYPPGQTGTDALLIVVALLLLASSVLMTCRELVPARISRD
jgi:ABC-2 type transport system permease protein